MPGDNFSRRVARAAAVGGGRSYRSQTPVVWYATLLAICLLGVGLVGYSRYERLNGVATPSAAKSPTAGNEWEAAVAVDVCGKIVPYALTDTVNPQAAYANIGDGVVDIQPQRSPTPASYEGKHAVLSGFLNPEGVVLTQTSLRYPGKPVRQKATTSTTTSSSSSTTTTTAKSKSKSKKAASKTSSSTTTTTTQPLVPGPAITHTNGQKCGSQAAVVQVKTWPSPSAKTGTLVTSNFGAIPLKNGELITIAFVPHNTSILKPPAAAVKRVSQFLIVNPAGVAPSTTTTTLPTTVPPTTGSSSTTSTTPGGSTSSSVTSST